MAKSKILNEFKEFINRGNVIDLAVGVIVGGAFTTIVNALVNDVVNPFISFLTGGSSEMSGLSVDLGGNVINFGVLLGAVINFLITAVVVFAIVKALNNAQKLSKKVIPGLNGSDDEVVEEPKPRLCPYCKQEIAEDATRCPHCTSKLEGYAGE